MKPTTILSALTVATEEVKDLRRIEQGEVSYKLPQEMYQYLMEVKKWARHKLFRKERQALKFYMYIKRILEKDK